MYEQSIVNWRKREYDVFYANNSEEARGILTSIIPHGAVISLGGSVTLQQMDVIELLRKGSYQLIDRYAEMSVEEREACFKKGLTADWLITSTNAITEAGELINVDGNGNRVAPLIYGAENVLVVVGKNKLVKSIEEGIERIRRIAPLNAKRLNVRTPCTVDGVCHDCQCESRICNMTTIIHNSYRFPKRIKILLINENIGY